MATDIDVGNFAGVAFDLEGTLARRDHHEASQLAAFDWMGLTSGDGRYILPRGIHGEAHYHGSDHVTIQGWLLQQAGLVSDEANLTTDRLVHWAVKVKLGFHAETIQRGVNFIDGAYETLKLAHEATDGNIALGTTARFWEAAAFIAHHGLGAYLPDGRMVTKETAERAGAGVKPDPFVFLETGRLLGVDMGQHPTDLLVIEDSPQGIEAGLRAGAVVAAIAGTFEPDYLAELPEERRPHVVAESHDALRVMMGL